MKKMQGMLLLTGIVLSTMCSGLKAGGVGKSALKSMRATSDLFAGALGSGTITMDTPVVLDPRQRIVVAGAVVVDGQGSYIEFTDPTFPQLVMLPGSSLTLQNVEFRNLKAASFDMRTAVSASYSDATIFIDKNVKWELDQDITFTNGFISVNNTDSPSQTNIFVMTGKNTRKKFYVAPALDQFDGSTGAQLALVLGHNTLQLENVEFRGVSAVSAVTDDVASSAIALSGNAGLDQDVQVNTINLFIEGWNNDLILRDTNYTLASNISFGDFPINNLSVNFSTTAEVLNYNIDFDPGIFLFSANGIARLDFKDYNVQLNLRNSNSFITDDAAILSYKNLNILQANGTFPIKCQSKAYRAEGFNLTGQGLDTATQRSPFKAKRFKHANALQMKRQQAADELAHARKSNKKNVKNNLSRPRLSYHVPSSKAKVSKAGHGKAFFRGLDELLAESDELEALQHEAILRSPMMSRLVFDGTVFSLVTDNTVIGKASSAAPYTGTWKFTKDAIVGDAVNGFTLNPDVSFSGLMETDARIYIKAGDTVRLDSDHKLYATGKNNVIEVAGTLHLSGNAFALDDNADVTILLAGSNARVLIGDKLELPQGSHFILDSRGAGGRITLNDGLEIAMGADINKDNRAIFEMRNDADVRLDGGNATARVTGVGIFALGAEGHLTVETSTLIFGQDSVGPDNALNRDTNDIIFDMHNGSLLDVYQGTVSFRYVGTDIFCNGTIDLNAGVFAINARGATDDRYAFAGATPGNLRSVSFNPNGVLSIHNESTLVIGQNYWIPTTGTFQTFNWDGRNSTFRVNSDGTARAQLIEIKAGQNRSFKGLINQISSGDKISNLATQITAGDIIIPLLQQVRGMADAVAYKSVNLGDTSGTMVVRTKDARAFVQIIEGNTVNGQSSDGGVVGSTADNKQFTISVDGVAIPDTVSVVIPLVEEC